MSRITSFPTLLNQNPCPCDGFRQDHSENVANVQMKSELICVQCKHKLVSHGNLTSLKPEELDK